VLKKEKVGLIRRESIRETGLNKGNGKGGIMVLLPELQPSRTSHQRMFPLLPLV